jgi:hypothetical protein
VLHHAFYDPERLKPDRSTAQVTDAAAREFAKLAVSLGARSHDAEQVAHFSEDTSRGLTRRRSDRG